MKVIQASYNFTDYYIEARTRLEEDMHQPNIIPYHKGFIVLSANYTQLHLNIRHSHRKISLIV